MPDNATIARTIYEAFNDEEIERGLALIGDDSVWVNIPTGDTFRGPEGFRRNYEQWRTAFPDGKCEEIDIKLAGDWAVVEFVGRGKNTGPLSTPAGELPATGRSIEVRFCDLQRIAGGKVVEGRSYFDMATMMAQLGLLPEPAGAAA